MREILFRGQTRRKGEKVRMGDGKPIDSNWVYGGIFPNNDGGDFAIIYQQEPEIKKFPVYADTVCQYTGRDCYSDKDDDLHKIFEGDIFDVTTFDHNGHDYHHICKVEWIGGGFALVSEKEDFFMWLGEVEDTESDLTLLGNIFDNPELLS